MQQARQLAPSIAQVRAAHKVIQPLINRTPMLQSDPISQAVSSADLQIRFFFKCENLQKSGSFKFRGATNFIAQQADCDLRKGVVAISTGNFGHAVALAARTAAQLRRIPIDAAVVLPSTSAPSKIAGAQRNGANVVLAGSDPQDRELMAKKLLSDTGATFIGPMDDTRIVCGQGTATLELIEQVEEIGSSLDAMILPSATGGILAGSAAVCTGSETLVFGCEPHEGGPNLRFGLASGILPNPKNQFSVADGLRASTSKGNFEFIREHVDGIHTATEQEIKQAWQMLIEQTGMLVEPSSAVAVATVMFNQPFRKILAARKAEWNIGIVLTGGNTTVSRIVEELGGSQGCFEEEDAHLQAAAY